MAWLRGVPTVDRALEQEIDGFVRVEKQTKADTKSVWGIIREYLVYDVLIGKLWLFPMVGFPSVRVSRVQYYFTGVGISNYNSGMACRNLLGTLVVSGFWWWKLNSM